MKMYIDDVRIDKIKEIMDIYPVDGVTSNPTILKKGNRHPLEVLKEIRAFIGEDKDLMTQVVSTSADTMVKAAAIGVDVWESFLKNEIVDTAIDTFNKDFEDLVGEGKTFLDL